MSARPTSALFGPVASTPAGVDSLAFDNRGYRFAQPPANGCYPFGMFFCGCPQLQFTQPIPARTRSALLTQTTRMNPKSGVVAALCPRTYVRDDLPQSHRPSRCGFHRAAIKLPALNPTTVKTCQ